MESFMIIPTFNKPDHCASFQCRANTSTTGTAELNPHWMMDLQVLRFNGTKNQDHFILKVLLGILLISPQIKTASSNSWGCFPFHDPICSHELHQLPPSLDIVIIGHLANQIKIQSRVLVIGIIMVSGGALVWIIQDQDLLVVNLMSPLMLLVLIS